MAGWLPVTGHTALVWLPSWEVHRAFCAGKAADVFCGPSEEIVRALFCNQEEWSHRGSRSLTCSIIDPLCLQGGLGATHSDRCG